MINYHPSLHRDVSGGIERLIVIEAKVYMFFTIVENQRSVFIPIPKKGNAKECSNYHKIAFISHTSEVMLKIVQARLQQYVNMNFQMFKLVLEKAKEPEIKLPTSIGLSKKQESSRKTSAEKPLLY